MLKDGKKQARTALNNLKVELIGESSIEESKAKMKCQRSKQAVNLRVVLGLL